MKKLNKSKLSITTETVRALSSAQLERVAGGLPQSRPGSGCMSCNCDTVDVCPSVNHTTCNGSACGVTCVTC